MIDLSKFYSGGYFLMRANDPDWGDEWRGGLLPTKLISLSECIGWQFRVNWGWIPGDREAALKFGIPETRLDACLEWCAYKYDTEMDIWSVFYSTSAVRRFIQQFEVPTDDLHIVGVGLPRQSDIVDYYTSSYSSPEDYGIEKLIKQKLSLEAGGQPLGFEVVSYSGYGRFSHSWLCSGLHQDMLDLFGIKPNSHGLIETQEEAVKVYEWIKEDEMKGHRGEPEPYTPWLLVDYPLTLDS
jgi:hypothetical protein